MEIIGLNTKGERIPIPISFLSTESDVHQILLAYSSISITFEVKTIFDLKLKSNGLQGIEFEERVVEPYIKNYDREESPEQWGKQWNLENWAMIIMFYQNQPIAGTIIAHNTTGVNMLQGRDDLAVIWDIRVSANYRGRGIGKIIFDQIISWCEMRNCCDLIVETQNINVGACKFYRRVGMKITRIDFMTYQEFPDEIQLIWHMDLI